MVRVKNGGGGGGEWESTLCYSKRFHGGVAWERQEGGVAKVCLKGMKWELRRKGVVESWRIPNLIKTW